MQENIADILSYLIREKVYKITLPVQERARNSFLRRCRVCIAKQQKFTLHIQTPM